MAIFTASLVSLLVFSFGSVFVPIESNFCITGVSAFWKHSASDFATPHHHVLKRLCH